MHYLLIDCHAKRHKYDVTDAVNERLGMSMFSDDDDCDPLTLIDDSPIAIEAEVATGNAIEDAEADAEADMVFKDGEAVYVADEAEEVA